MVAVGALYLTRAQTRRQARREGEGEGGGLETTHSGPDPRPAGINVQSCSSPFVRLSGFVGWFRRWSWHSRLSAVGRDDP